MIGVYEINIEANVWLLEGRASETALVKYSQQVCCVKAASLVNTGEKRKTEDCSSSITVKRAREERLIVLKERNEREETGRGEGTAHMLSHCF